MPKDSNLPETIANFIYLCYEVTLNTAKSKPIE